MKNYEMLYRMAALLLITMLMLGCSGGDSAKPSESNHPVLYRFVDGQKRKYEAISLLGTGASSLSNHRAEYLPGYKTALEGESSIIWVVTDQEIKKIAPDGTVLVNLTSVFDKGFSYTDSPDIMDIDRHGNIWITDSCNDRIFSLYPDGNPILEISSNYPVGIAVDYDSGQLCIWTSEPGKIKKLAWSGYEIITVHGFSDDISAISIGESGNIWLSDRGNNQLVVLRGDDTDLNGYDASALEGPHHCRYSGYLEPTDIAINLNDDSQGANNLWVSDRQSGEAIKFSPQALELVRIRQPLHGDSNYISINPFEGNIWIGTTDQTEGLVSNFSATGDELISFPVDSVAALGVNPADDTLWVANGIDSAAMVKQFDYTGNELLSISCAGTVKDILVSVPESPTQVVQPFYAEVSSVDNPTFWGWEVGDYISGSAVFDNAKIHPTGDYTISHGSAIYVADEYQDFQLMVDLEKWIITEQDDRDFGMGFPRLGFCDGTLCDFSWYCPQLQNTPGLEAFSFGQNLYVRSSFPENYVLRGVFSLHPEPGPSFKIIAQDGEEADYFGNSVSCSGDLALIGAYGDVENGIKSGSAYIFRKDGINYVQEQKIITQNPAAGDKFGYAVSISDNVALVGSYGDDENGSNSGSAYVFRFNGDSWIEEQKLIPQDGTEGQKFGYSVSISGDYALVGAYGDDANGINSGSAYVFRYVGNNWIQEQKLIAQDGDQYDLFGQAVSMNGNLALAGSYGNDEKGTNSGAAYVFRRNGSNWVQEQKLVAQDGNAGDNFGFAVSTDWNIALIGAKSDDDNGTSAGSAYVFRYNGNSWVQEQKLLAGDGAAGDKFGYGVSVSGLNILVGAYGDDYGFSSGSAYLFRWDYHEWTLEKKLIAPDCSAGDHFGYSVSISGLNALVGAHFNDDMGFASGSAYMSLYDQDEDGIPDWWGTGVVSGSGPIAD